MALLGNENENGSQEQLEEKEKRIKKEILRIKKSFKKIPKNYMVLVNSLIENAAFMTVQLEDLQKAINEKGVTQEYQNGENQKGIKKSTEIEIYNTTIKNHAMILKQLADMVPECDKSEEEKKEMDPFQKMMVAAHGKR